MDARAPSSQLAAALAVAAVCAVALGAALAAGAARAQASSEYLNLTAGAPLRPGVYGRIAVPGAAAPPALIFAQPVIANRVLVPADVHPVYLYVPPGQVRQWKRSCAQWRACNEPVLFVRVENSPSRWGRWRHLRDDGGLQQPD